MSDKVPGVPAKAKVSVPTAPKVISPPAFETLFAYTFLEKKSKLFIEFAFKASKGTSNIKFCLFGSVTKALPAESFESPSILTAKVSEDPSLETIDSATLKSESIEKEFEEGTKGKAEDNQIDLFEPSEDSIKIGAIDVPSPSFTLKYNPLYPFSGSCANEAGKTTYCVFDPTLAKVPVIEIELTSKTFTVKV